MSKPKKPTDSTPTPQRLEHAAQAFGLPALRGLVARFTTAEEVLAMHALDPALDGIPRQRIDLYHQDVRALRSVALDAGAFTTDPHWTVDWSVALLRHVALHHVANLPLPRV